MPTFGVMDVFTSTSTRWVYDRSFNTIRQMVEDRIIKNDTDMDEAMKRYAALFDRDVQLMMGRGIIASVYFDR
jgi:hypothetical protein